MDRLSPLASPSATRAVLEAHGLSTKYSLGQNFLVNDAILRKIVALAELAPEDEVLEVGPGIGTLTVALLKRAGRVASVERDADLPAVLAETLAPWADRFTLVEKDALDLTAADLPFSPTKLVANLPYAVAATVVLDCFERFPGMESATVMVQKEVADRMAADPGSKNYGAYTVKLRLYAEPVGRFSVGPGNFFPPPRVESAVVRLDRRPLSDGAGDPLGEAALKAACVMADAAFATRRKTLANSCRTYFAGRGREGARIAAALPRLFECADVDPARRGETLSLDEFVRLGAAYRSLA
ncbi:16S rRNA (adenine(1518)-N(6)/adenine(1519)-N(6))-dimethyltransferase [Gordonibacter sp. An230]|uniref:16S rRNA (adenine(1518)-N(6)/adenine(1519)-N(6))- dimethyltransferase RsmA n=1 Tax=Gordonibacter sp. An230 TaxID=1965592 RepID=UPI000B3A058F|nr:16S rRNA (adenine(1518)-N(6)/adenine(1519)-N(6))-dimethyltransferase RsmA [Gordonibacter sp. An230]OUO88620.1 16S rRNA (adenine(1518)-N(6)/adenine(1519)-N(6))-dimethyltransferase [Gordonibacter sp. An230]